MFGHGSPPERQLRLIVANSLDEIPRLAGEVEAFGRGAGLGLDTVDAVNIALDELVTNIIRYGEASPAGIQVVLSLVPGRLEIEIVDDGHPFDPLVRPMPDVALDIDARPVGGLGIHFVRSLMDECSYRRDCERNRIRLVKRLPRS